MRAAIPYQPVIHTLNILYNMDKNKIMVLLDNGHGNNTPGKRSPKLDDGRQLLEWSYARGIVKGIAESLKASGIPYYIIHPEDEEIGCQSKDLILRTNRANSKHLELKKKGMTSFFISVHVNAAGNGKPWSTASGWEVYIAKSASQNSKKLAQILYSEAEKRNLKGNRSVGADKYRMEDFWVVRKTYMPAVLTENLFMDNKGNVEFLLSEEGKKTIIDLHVEGIKKYIESL